MVFSPPSVDAVAERIARQDEQTKSFYIEGSIGSGRTSLVQQLSTRGPTLLIELLPLRDIDCAAVAWLEARSALQDGSLEELSPASEDDYFRAGVAVITSARKQGLRPVLRLPYSWSKLTQRPLNDHAWHQHARGWLRGLLTPHGTLVVVADAAITIRELGFHPDHWLTPLASHRTSAIDLQDVAWGAYQDALETLVRDLPHARASLLEWRLAVGLAKLGTSSQAITGLLRATPALPGLATALADSIASIPVLATAARGLLQLRRPIASTKLIEILSLPAEHQPLFTECLAYGTEQVRVPTTVRAKLRAALSASSSVREFRHSRRDREPEPSPREQNHLWHQRMVDHYKSLDGAPGIMGLGPSQARAWCEKVHHLSFTPDAPEWDDLEMAAPEQFWSRARELSFKKEFQRAASIYQACLRQFPGDSYATHYLAHNLQRAGGSTSRAEEAYRTAVTLDPENPWWNTRLVTFLITSGQPASAIEEWAHAIERVDPDGEKLSADPWLARHMHQWVARDWLRSGRRALAADILRPITARIFYQEPRLRALKEAVGRTPQETGDREDPRWGRFLDTLETRLDLSAEFSDSIRHLWRALRALAGPYLPLPMADRTADQESFQFCWRYVGFLLEIELGPSGEVFWFGHAGSSHESGETTAEQLVALAPWLERAIRGR